MQLKDQLISKIENGQRCIGIVGLGYVGLPLALEFAKAGFKVIGYDVSERVVKALMSREVAHPGRPERGAGAAW